MPFVPIANPQYLLPSFSLTDFVRDASRMDASGFDGDTCGGITFSFTCGIRANTLGSVFYAVVCPNDLETNQTCTGDFAYTRLVLAVMGIGAAQDTMTCTWTMPVTKRGAPRAWSAVTSMLSGATYTQSGVWADTTTRINMFRTKWIYAQPNVLDMTTQDQFLQHIPAGGLSHYEWHALGNP